jgi:hypothetical protein
MMAVASGASTLNYETMTEAAPHRAVFFIPHSTGTTKVADAFPPWGQRGDAT